LFLKAALSFYWSKKSIPNVHSEHRHHQSPITNHQSPITNHQFRYVPAGST
jgi:hypothetical protein